MREDSDSSWSASAAAHVGCSASASSSGQDSKRCDSSASSADDSAFMTRPGVGNTSGPAVARFVARSPRSEGHSAEALEAWEQQREDEAWEQQREPFLHPQLLLHQHAQVLPPWHDAPPCASLCLPAMTHLTGLPRGLHGAPGVSPVLARHSTCSKRSKCSTCAMPVLAGSLHACTGSSLHAPRRGNAHASMQAYAPQLRPARA